MQCFASKAFHKHAACLALAPWLAPVPPIETPMYPRASSQPQNAWQMTKQPGAYWPTSARQQQPTRRQPTAETMAETHAETAGAAAAVRKTQERNIAQQFTGAKSAV